MAAPSTDDKIRDAKEAFLVSRFRRPLKHIQSPIEELFLWALVGRTWPDFELFECSPGESHACEEMGVKYGVAVPLIVGHGSVMNESFDDADLLWLVQFPVESFRVDFALFVQPYGRHSRHGANVKPADVVRFAVELDGHDFHEKTKEQAQRDKERDRVLTAAGWRPVHFTGSEVYRDADGCVEELYSLARGTMPVSFKERT